LDVLRVLALALLPAAGNFAGGVLAELIPTSRRTLSRALHVAAGIIVAVVGVELRIPMKPDAYSKVKPDTRSDFIPVSVPN
jgi:ZIP family zinc transporter